MKLPLKPPSNIEILKEIVKEDKLLKVLEYIPGNLPKKYLHWDQLRFHKPPEGLTQREWWFIIKRQRDTTSKKITLEDKNNKPFEYDIVEPMLEMLHKIDLNAGGGILMEEKNISPESKDQYIVRSLIEEAITSSQIEGASTTRMVAKELIRTGRQPKDRSERMILNNYFTMKSIAEFKEDSLSQDLVFQIHELITRDALDNPTAAGRFRREDEPIEVAESKDNIVLHVPPPASELPERMKIVCDFANCKDELGFIHPVVRSIILHFWLAYDHPFCDGNGRTARALFYWSMLHHKYWLFEFISISEIILKARSAYLKAFLYTETDNNDLTYFILYHLKIIYQAIDALHAYIDQRTRELTKLESGLRSITKFNHRQRALLSHALNHPHSNYTVKGHQTSHDVTYQTARTDLLELERLGLLESSKYKRAWFFRVVDNLEEKLANL